METTFHVTVAFGTETEQIESITVSTTESYTDVLVLTGEILEELDNEVSFDTAITGLLAPYGYYLDSVDGSSSSELYGTCTGDLSAEQVIAEGQLQWLGFESVEATKGGNIAVLLPALKSECDCGSGFSINPERYWTVRDIGHTTPCCNDDIIDLCSRREVISLDNHFSVQSVVSTAEELLSVSV